MFDWKQNIDEKLKREEEERQDRARRLHKGAEAVQGILDDVRTAFANKVFDADHHRAARKLAENFRCQMQGCNVHGEGPARKFDGYTTYRPDHEFAQKQRVQRYVDDWSRPGNLGECSRCHRWACYAHHLHKGICKECGERM